MLALLLTAIGLSVALAAYLAALAVYEPKERVEERLGRVFGERAAVAAAPAVPDEPLLQRAVLPLLTEMSSWLIRVTPVGWRNSLRRKLPLARHPAGLETGQYMAL